MWNRENKPNNYDTTKKLRSRELGERLRHEKKTLNDFRSGQTVYLGAAFHTSSWYRGTWISSSHCNALFLLSDEEDFTAFVCKVAANISLFSYFTPHASVSVT